MNLLGFIWGCYRIGCDRASLKEPRIVSALNLRAALVADYATLALLALIVAVFLGPCAVAWLKRTRVIRSSVIQRVSGYIYK